MHAFTGERRAPCPFRPRASPRPPSEIRQLCSRFFADAEAAVMCPMDGGAHLGAEDVFVDLVNDRLDLVLHDQLAPVCICMIPIGMGHS